MAKKNLSTINLQGLGVNNAIAPVGELTNDEKAQRVSGRSSRIAEANASANSPYSGSWGAPTSSEAIAHAMGAGTDNADVIINSTPALAEAANAYDNGNMTYDDFLKAYKATQTPAETPTAPANPSNDDAYQRALQETLANYQRAEQERAAALQRNYDNAVGQLRNAYNSNAQSLKANSDDALRQAYISYMLGQRGLNQQLANNGMTGGATESVLANLYNEYGGNRADIQKGLQNNLAQLQANYQNGLANLGANYGSNYADILADYYNQAASVNNSYATNLAKQLGKETATGTGDDTVKHSVERASVVNTLKGNANSPSNIIRYLNMLGDYTDAEKEMMLIEAGIDPVALTTQLGGTASNGATKDYTPTNTSGVTREDGTHIDGNGNVWDKDGNWVGKLG